MVRPAGRAKVGKDYARLTSPPLPVKRRENSHLNTVRVFDLTPAAGRKKEKNERIRKVSRRKRMLPYCRLAVLGRTDIDVRSASQNEIVQGHISTPGP